ncbi:hypothetical protein Pcinc_029098 [Petrolisthes cinctipes]|uniref:Uncharacterized protein n=1 Tax=Petrolisthes cinctipes TaxID=88211 RepID=A0AAE1F1K7_PETCI|nr:hypothetical protein Pcinc_029098 [Petrolisthes cinctipes]
MQDTESLGWSTSKAITERSASEDASCCASQRRLSEGHLATPPAAAMCAVANVRNQHNPTHGSKLLF